MLSVLANRTYRHLFLAQVIALLGTGLTTVALALLAFDLAGDQAGIVLGTAFAIKMAAYVGIAPIAAAFAERFPRRTALVALDAIRAAVALFLPFVSEIWQIYTLIFVLQSASAAFTPAFQATIPDVLPDEKDYTRALSLSRLAYDLENLVSPMLAAILLTIVSFHTLFAGTAIGFLLSGALILSVILPRPKLTERRKIYDQTTRGTRIYLATPRLRGLLALNLAAAGGGAMVIVNTVVYVRGVLGRTDADVALALALFGIGSMSAALVLPKLLEKTPDRTVMLCGGASLVVAMLAVGAGLLVGAVSWVLFLVALLVLGLGYSAILTPSGRLLRRSSQQNDRSILFAAQFALSHACWLLTYPLAGWLGAEFGMTVAFLTLGAIAALGVLAAIIFWPRDDPEVISHLHNDLPPDHPHLCGAKPTKNGLRHAHVFVVDDLHRSWPALDKATKPN